MKKLFQKIKIENLAIIQQELLNLIPEEKVNLSGSKVESWTLDKNIILPKCSYFNDFLMPRLKKNIMEIKFYVSPVGIGTGYHIDGTTNRNPFALTIPVKNTKNTYLNWYEEDITNFRKRPLNIEPIHKDFECGISEIFVPINPEKLELIDSYEILEASFTRGDLMHRVINNSGGVRIVLTVRWPTNYTEIEDVLDTTGILLD